MGAVNKQTHSTLMGFAFQFDEARYRQNTKIKQNIQYIDVAMATKE